MRELCERWLRTREPELGALLRANRWVCQETPVLHAATALWTGQTSTLGPQHSKIVAGWLPDPDLGRAACRYLPPYRLLQLWLRGQAPTALVDRKLRRAGPRVRAVYLLLSGDHRAYAELDFEQAYLKAAYRRARPGLQARLLQAARQAGRVEFLRGLELSRPAEARALRETGSPQAVLQAAVDSTPRLAALLLPDQAPPRLFRARQPALRLGPARPATLAVSSGAHLVAAGLPDGRVLWWHRELGTGELPAVIRGVPPKVAVSLDGSWLAATMGRRTQVLRLGGERAALTGNGPLAFECNLLATSFGQRVYVWKLPELTLHRQLETGHNVVALEFCNEHFLLVAHPGEVSRWQVDLAEKLASEPAPEGARALHSFGAENWGILGARLRVFDQDHPAPDAFALLPLDAHCPWHGELDTALPPTRRWLGVTWKRGRLHLTGSLRRPLPVLRGGSSCSAFSPEGLWLASAGEDEQIRVWSLADLLEAEALSRSGALDQALSELDGRDFEASWRQSELAAGPLTRQLHAFIAILLEERFKFALQLGTPTTGMDDILVE